MATIRLLVVVDGGDELDAAAAAVIGAWVRAGGGLIVVGGAYGLEAPLGVAECGTLGEAFVTFPLPGFIFDSETPNPLHIYRGALLKSSGARPFGLSLDSEARQLPGAPIFVNRHGLGVAIAIGPDIIHAVNHIQTGSFVDRDGDPPGDGTAAVDEGIHKTDDGSVLSWTWDRTRTPPSGLEDVSLQARMLDFPDGDVPWYRRAVADEHRDLLFRVVAWAGVELGIALARIRAWPQGLEAVALLSLDSDLNDDAAALHTLSIVDNLNIKATWLMQWREREERRLSPFVHDEVRQSGHEIGLHFNAYSPEEGRWERKALDEQLRWLAKDSGIPIPMSNKNHYFRWEGDLEFFRWLESAGVQVDQSKAGSKRGNMGFPHGSCLPWRPLDPENGRFIDVVEIATATQDLWLTADWSCAPGIVNTALRHGGVAHFLFHPIHVRNERRVQESLERVVSYGADAGLGWWTSAQINSWQRRRRDVRTSALRDGNLISVELSVADDMPGASIFVQVPRGFRVARATLGQLSLPVTWDRESGVGGYRIEVGIPAGDSRISLYGD